jgi:hypothetical protein
MTRTRTSLLLMLLAVAACRAAAPPSPASDREWWSDVQTLASDDMQGRKTGTEGYRKAADYVAKQFAALGLQPAGTDGYLQPITFESRKLVEDRSALELRRDGKVIPIAFGTQAIAIPVGSPEKVDAGLVFAGYGLTIPDFHYDDFANVDASGKIVVILQGAPAGVPSTVAAHYSSTEEATRNLTAHGAIGALLIANPRLVEIPWDRMAAMRSQFGQTMDLAEPGLTIGGMLRVVAWINSEQATMFFGGSGIDLGRVLEADAAKQPLPHGPLNGRLQGRCVRAVDRQGTECHRHAARWRRSAEKPVRAALGSS